MLNFLLDEIHTFEYIFTFWNTTAFCSQQNSFQVYLILVSCSYQNWLSLLGVRAADSGKVWIWIHLLWYRDRRWKAKCLKSLLDIGMSNSMKRWMHKLQGRLCVEFPKRTVISPNKKILLFFFFPSAVVLDSTCGSSGYSAPPCTSCKCLSVDQSLMSFSQSGLHSKTQPRALHFVLYNIGSPYHVVKKSEHRSPNIP